MKNLELKEKFLKNKNDTIKQLFVKICEFEEKFNKDVFEFGYTEMEEVLTEITDKNVKGILSKYIDYAISQNYSLSKINIINAM